MMKSIIKTGITLAIIAVVPVFLWTSIAVAQESAPPSEPVPAAEEPLLPSTPEIQQSLCAGANLDVTSDCSQGVSNNQAADYINDIVADIINLFSWVIGIVSVIMIIIGGFRYITSGGDSNNVSAAKNTILYAIIGLVIVALSQTIVRFILGRVIQP